MDHLWIIYGYGWWLNPTPLKNMKVHWDDDYSQYMGKGKIFQTTDQIMSSVVLTSRHLFMTGPRSYESFDMQLAFFQKIPFPLGKAGGQVQWFVFGNMFLPSSNQSWQWKMDHLSVIFLLNPPLTWHFKLPCLITRG